MAQCHWHPERTAQTKCDLCGKPMCSACSTQVAEPPESYRLCPECLVSLEKLVDRGLTLQTQNVSVGRAWLGAASGGTLALFLWVLVINLIEPSWYQLIRWIGYVNCGLISALFAIRFTGNRRGRRVLVPTIIVTAAAILIGHYISAIVEIHSYLTANPNELKSLVDAGVISGWWLPTSLVLPVSWHIVGWKDLGVVVAALYIAYAFTHRGRMWESHHNKPLSSTDDSGAAASS